MLLYYSIYSAPPTKDAYESVSADTMNSWSKTFLSYTIMRLVEPEAEWGLYSVAGNGRIVSIVCMDKNKNVVDIDYSHLSDVYSSLDISPLCNMDVIYHLYGLHIKTMDREAWTNFIESYLDAYDIVVPRKRIELLLRRRSSLLLPFAVMKHDDAERLADIALDYRVLDAFDDILHYIPSPGCRIEIPTPRHGIIFPGETSFSFQ